jgi:hypothetical protein
LAIVREVRRGGPKYTVQMIGREARATEGRTNVHRADDLQMIGREARTKEGGTNVHPFSSTASTVPAVLIVMAWSTATPPAGLRAVSVVANPTAANT